jgi:ABC-2 type transport system ATP-binding protein
MTLPSPTHADVHEDRLLQPLDAARDGSAPARQLVIEASDVTREFDGKVALDGASLEVGRGDIHALLGPNGAGKTTLLRILSGFIHPSSGSVRILGMDVRNSPRMLRQRLGLIPSGDRSFYLRISGIENLVFFARMHGLRRKEAFARAREVLDLVELPEAAELRVGAYSHGMVKRLSIARSLLTDPEILLVDEATHDLDPEGARTVRELVGRLADRGTAVIWTTQRIDEIKGFAQTVTLLNRGQICFAGTVPQLMAQAVPRRWLLRLRNGALQGSNLLGRAEDLLAGLGELRLAGDGDPEHFLLALPEGIVLGDALSALLAGDVQVLACRGERSEIEDAFLELTRSSP